MPLPANALLAMPFPGLDPELDGERDVPHGAFALQSEISGLSGTDSGAEARGTTGRIVPGRHGAAGSESSGRTAISDPDSAFAPRVAGGSQSLPDALEARTGKGRPPAAFDATDAAAGDAGKPAFDPARALPEEGPAATGISTGTAVPNDPRLGEQWHLGNPNPALLDLNVRDVWDPADGVGYSGFNTRTVVIDDGFDYLHPDLAGAGFGSVYDQQADIDFDPNNDGTAGSDSDAFGHAGNLDGTPVAGIIGADNNATGMVGVAFDTAMIGYRVHDEAAGVASNAFLSDAQAALANARQSLLGAHIINVSVGISDFHVTQFGFGYSSALFGEIEFEIGQATANGNGGRGITIVKAAGDARVGAYDINADNWANDTRQVVVAAVNQDGFVTSSSSYGSPLLVSAFGTGIRTTDRSGLDGHSITDFATYEGGTGAAAAMVSGVVALMYQASVFGLGWRDVQSILAASARHVGSEVGAGSWQWNASGVWNGGGMHFSRDYGYGLVDARAAVRMAESWLLTSDAATTGTQSSFTLDMHSGALAIPDGNATGVTFSESPLFGMEVERVTLQLTFSTTFLADLEVYITSPSGTVDRLIDEAGGNADFTGTWTFETQAFRGEQGAGEWSVRIVDDAGGDLLTVSGVRLQMFGRSDSNDRYVFTNEYSDYAGIAGHRTAINDANGGVDTVNAAAVSSDSVIRLDGGAGSIDGVAVTLANMEHAIGGDGDDRVSGHAGANGLFGMRGNDILAGLAGADQLDGGLGVDTADYSASPDRVNVNLWTEAGLGGHAHGDTLVRIENIIGSNSALADFLTGDLGDNVIAGLAGPDQIDGFGGGSDTVDLSASPDRVSVNLTTGAGAGGHAQGDTYANMDNIIGSNSSLPDFLTGNAGVNRIEGRNGDDVIIGLAGADTQIGGAGRDTVNFSASPSRININLTTGAGLGGHAHGDSFAEIENIIGTNDSAADFLTGSAADNVIAGLAGPDDIDGMGGADTVDLSASAGAVSVNLTTGAGSGGDAQGDTYANMENIVGSNSGSGDVLIGNGDSNLIAGLAGADQINGLAGLDTVDFSTSPDRVSVNLTTGAGLGGHAHGDSFANVENIAGSNSALADFLTGNAGDNVIAGLAGPDQINGLGGVDTVAFSASTGGVTVNLATGAGAGGHAQGDSYAGIENIIGSPFSDVLTGQAGVNVIEGLDGDDVLDGRAGPDLLLGGAGADTVLFSASPSRVNVNLNTATGVGGDAHGDTFANIENIIGSNDSLADFLTGNGSANVIAGLAGPDQIDGLGGTDTISFVQSPDRVSVSLMSGAGLGGHAHGDSYANIENIIGSNAALPDFLTGNGGVNRIEGQAGNDILAGLGGGDVLLGGAGGDTADYSASSDRVSVNLTTGIGLGGHAHGDSLSGIENLVGTHSAMTDFLTGNIDSNRINGLSGSDRLNGGGGGNDIFVFSSGIGAGNVDDVIGFNVATDGFEIDNAVFTGLAAGALAASAFVIGSAATTAAHRIIYNQANGALFFDSDGAGGGAQVQFALAAPGLAMTSNDFFVI